MLLFKRLPGPLKINFNGQHGPNMTPTGPPRWPQVGPKMVPKSVWGAHGAPWRPMGPHGAPPEPVLARFWTGFDRFLMNFVAIFGRYVVAYWGLAAGGEALKIYIK